MKQQNRLPHNSRHEFALYIPQFSYLIASYAPADRLVLDDSQEHYRLVHILRIRKEDTLVLFDQKKHARVTVAALDKKTVTVTLDRIAPNTMYSPSITVFLPVLKRDDLQQAVATLVSTGVTTIQLVITEKVQRAWGGAKELARLQRVAIAAAEQSKCFAFPTIAEPILLSQVLPHIPSTTLFFDPTGAPAQTVLHTLVEQQPDCIGLLVGPEGDLIVQEKQLLQEHNVLFCALTPTVLRAWQAVTVGAGMIRSVL